MKEYIDNIKNKLGFRSYPKLAELLGVTKDTIMKLNQGAGSRKLQIAYTLFSLCLDEMSEVQKRKLIAEYHALLYRRMYAEQPDNDELRGHIDNLMEMCGYASYAELAKFLEATEDLLVKLSNGESWRRLRVIYVLLSLAFGRINTSKVQRVLKKYHSLLYKKSAI